MAVNDPAAPEEELRRITPIVLRGGLVVSMTFIGLGMLRYAMRPGEYAARWYDLSHGGPLPGPFDWRHDLGQVLHLEPRPLVYLGLAVLTATPLLRVVLCAVAFARAKNTTFVALTGVVLVLLGVAMLLGRIG